MVDVKGNRVDVKGNIVDVKGNSVDVKGNIVDVKGNSVDVKRTLSFFILSCSRCATSYCASVSELRYTMRLVLDRRGSRSSSSKMNAKSSTRRTCARAMDGNALPDDGRNQSQGTREHIPG
eukprot:307932-Prorocentrum_minimum.AAC.1